MYIWCIDIHSKWSSRFLYNNRRLICFFFISLDKQEVALQTALLTLVLNILVAFPSFCGETQSKVCLALLAVLCTTTTSTLVTYYLVYHHFLASGVLPSPCFIDSFHFIAAQFFKIQKRHIYIFILYHWYKIKGTCTFCIFVIRVLTVNVDPLLAIFEVKWVQSDTFYTSQGSLVNQLYYSILSLQFLNGTNAFINFTLAVLNNFLIMDEFVYFVQSFSTNQILVSLFL